MAADRPWRVQVGTDRARAYAREESAYGYALAATLKSRIGTHTVISHRGHTGSVVLDREMGGRISCKFTIPAP